MLNTLRANIPHPVQLAIFSITQKDLGPILVCSVLLSVLFFGRVLKWDGVDGDGPAPILTDGDLFCALDRSIEGINPFVYDGD